MDQKTNFDLRAEVYKNGVLIASGETYCIQGLVADGRSARDITVPFAPFTPTTWNGTSDVLSFRVLARIGTNGDGTSCGGTDKAFGLRMYFDSAQRPREFAATIP